jgi:RNA-dependent RNA polymerase
MACLLLDKIPRNVDEFSLYRVLSKVIHDDPGRRFGDLMNFDVVLGSWKGRPSEPMARITIPYAEYRDQLFEIPIKIKGQKTIWHKDEAPADAATVRQLILVPYRDPKALREIQVLTDTRVRVVKVQFGVLSFSPDTKIPPIFSPEWGKDCAEDCYVAFDHSENRSLRVRIGGHSDITARSIAISLSNVERLLIGHDTSPYMLFRLFNPPGFESEDQYRTTTGVAFSDRRNQRQRHAALDDQHKRVAPFTSRTLRLVLHRAEDIEGFSTLARNLKVPLDIRQAPSSGLDVSHRKFYSPDNLFHLEKWFKELGKSSWSVAFQCAALHQNALLRPDQLLSLRDGIERLISRLGTDTAASVLRHVVTLLKAAPQNPQFLHAFRRAESDHNKSARQSKLTPWKNMWSCRHVMVSPTTVSLDGTEALSFLAFSILTRKCERTLTRKVKPHNSQVYQASRSLPPCSLQRREPSTLPLRL